MKNNVLVIAIVSLALAACSKEVTQMEHNTGNTFEKGQKVTLSVSTGERTKVTSESTSATEISFKWEAGDKILVTVNSKTAVFTLESGQGTSQATFQGTMPDAGSVFDVQFPEQDPELSSQTYSSSEPIPHNMMKFTATDCSIDSPFTLTASNSVLMLNLYASDVTAISKIEVTDKSSNNKYALNLSPSVTLPTSKDEPMPFFIVVPTGTYNFSAKVINEAATPKFICKYETSSPIEFSPNNFYCMPKKEVAASANCYIVSSAGDYKFKPWKGNTTQSVGTINSVEVLWETFGTNEKPSAKDLISAVSYDSGHDYIFFTATDKKGNACIVAKDASNNILWSWHIWLTDKPEVQIYNNNAGKMMDRNLGATTATKGAATSLGLLYQWGRKDPFLGSSSISEATVAVATGPWGTAKASERLEGGVNTLSSSIKNPTTFLTSTGEDWYCTSYENQNDTLWSSEKTMFDPCPYGYRVPEGGSEGTWAKAFNYFEKWETAENYDNTNKGFDFGVTDKKLGNGSIWYPAAGVRSVSDGVVAFVPNNVNYWSCTALVSSANSYAYLLYGHYSGYVDPVGGYPRGTGQSVRCIAEE